MFRKKLAPGLIGGGHRFSDKDMRQRKKKIMLGLRTLAFSAAAALSLWGAASAAECTIDRDGLDDAVAQAPSCAAAYKIFEDCALGGSSDVEFGSTVQERCEADFLSKLDAARKSAYNKQLAACDRKYAHKSGTMYLSFMAFCRVSAARDLAKKYSK